MKESAKIEFRKSNKSEVDQAVPLIYSSGPDAFEYVFKNTRVVATDFLKYAFVREGGEFSFRNHYSLYLNDQMIGIGSVFNAKEAGRFTLHDAFKILRFYKFHSFPTLKNGIKIERIIRLPHKNEIVLAHLAIESD